MVLSLIVLNRSQTDKHISTHNFQITKERSKKKERKTQDL
jgi:hypothetical protein